MVLATYLPRLMVRRAVVLSLAALLYNAAPASAQALLGSAQSYAVLGASTVTNTGPSDLTGDLGVSPGTAIIGFPPGRVGGARHAADAAAGRAQEDAELAFTTLGGLPCTRDLTGVDLGGLILTPGVYCFSSSAQLTGTLTLDAQGNPDALFVFRMGSALTTASNSSVVMIGGGTCNVYWHATSSVTLGTGTQFLGHILARASVTMTTRADLIGSAFALTGAVTLDSNIIDATACGGVIVSNKPRLCVTGSGEIAVPSPNNIRASAGGPGRASFSLDARRNREDGPVTGFFEYENPVQRVHVRGKVTKLEVLSRNADGTPKTVLASGVCDKSVPKCVFAVTVREDEPGTSDHLGIAVTGAMKEVRSLRVVRGGSLIFSK